MGRLVSYGVRFSPRHQEPTLAENTKYVRTSTWYVCTLISDFSFLSLCVIFVLFFHLFFLLKLVQNLAVLSLCVCKMKLNLVIFAPSGTFGGILRRRLRQAPAGRGRLFWSASLACDFRQPVGWLKPADYSRLKSVSCHLAGAC